MKIAILGDGITAKAVRDTVLGLPGYLLVDDVFQAELVITSPGIAPSTFPAVQVPIISEIEFAYRLFHRPDSTYRPKLIGVTGTNGKTTVTSMIAWILGCPTAGNIGYPLIHFVDQTGQPEWLSVELSSFQLECCTTFRPEIAVWTNLTEDHMDRHHRLDEYGRQKAKICLRQTADDSLIYPDHDLLISGLVKSSDARKIGFSEAQAQFRLFEGLSLKGRHNQLNALAAYWACLQTGMSSDAIIQRLYAFQAVEHRIEYVLTYQGREFYNDSKGTNPDSTITAVDAFDQPIHLLICGKDKGLHLDDFIRYLHQKVKSIVLFGEITDRFRRISDKINPKFPLFSVSNMQEAIPKAFSLSEAGDVILLSPSSSSFDQFHNYEERGRLFKQLVKESYAKTSY